MKVQETVDFIFPASNLLTILIQYSKNFLDCITWSLQKLKLFSCLNSLNNVSLVKNDHWKPEKIGSVE